MNALQVDNRRKGKEGEMISESMFPVPHDKVELEQTVSLLEKLPACKAKLRSLELEIDRFAKSAASVSPYAAAIGIEYMIYRAFYAELEDRPFQAPTEDELRRLSGDWHIGVIRRRNMPCEICGENRSTDRCHIMPNHLGGSAMNANLLILCPTHHRLFDRHMLSRAEFARIDWSNKSDAAQAYVKAVILNAQKSFWRQIDQQRYESLGEYHEDASSLPFVRYATEQVLNVFSDSRPIPRAKVYDLVSPELRELAKRVIDTMVKHRYLQQKRKGSINMVARTDDCPEIDDHIVHRIWQQVS